MKTFKMLSVGAGAMVLALAGFAQAEPGAGPRDHAGRRGPLAQLLSERAGKARELKAELALTPEQKEQVKEILKSHKEEITAAAKTSLAKRKALHEAVTAATPDEAAIRAAATELGKAIGDAAVIRSKIHGEIAKVLTAEQLEKLKKFRAERDAAVDDAVDDMGKEL